MKASGKLFLFFAVAAFVVTFGYFIGNLERTRAMWAQGHSFATSQKAGATISDPQHKELACFDHCVTNRWGYSLVMFTPKLGGALGRVIVQTEDGKSFTLYPANYLLTAVGEPNDKYDWRVWAERYEQVLEEFATTQPTQP